VLVIDDFKEPTGSSRFGTAWRLVTDGVMGGSSSGGMMLREVDGYPALCIHGDVSLENNGGFVQAVLDLAREGHLDASSYQGIRVLVRGNGETYNLHLKTADVRFPWQSYRASFLAEPRWRELRMPFAAFRPHRVDAPLDTERLSRLGFLAIGRRFTADLCVAEVAFY